MYIHPLFLLVPILAVASTVGMSLAIVGTGNRKIWLLVAPVVSVFWISTGILLARLTPVVEGSFDPLPAQFLVTIFFLLSLPVVLCLCAFMFRKSRGARH